MANTSEGSSGKIILFLTPKSPQKSVLMHLVLSVFSQNWDQKIFFRDTTASDGVMGVTLQGLDHTNSDLFDLDKSTIQILRFS